VQLFKRFFDFNMKLKPNETKLVIALSLVAAAGVGMILFTKISDILILQDSAVPFNETANRPKSKSLSAGYSSSTPIVVQGQSTRKLVGNAKSIYILPLGNFRRTHIQAFLREYRDKIKGDFIVLEPLHKNFENPSRQQDNSQDVLNGIAREYPQYAQRCLIAITDRDLYTPDRPDWRFVFADRVKSDLFAVGVIATARLKDDLTDDAVGSQRLKSRVGKLFKKSVGMLAENRPISEDRQSVMFGPVLSGDELDQVGWDY